MLRYTIDPLQPYFVLNAKNYYKKVPTASPVAHFYRFTCKEIITMPNGAVPDGTIDIIFDCGEQNPSAIVADTVEKGEQNIFQQNHTYFGVRFLPGILDHFGNISAGELTGMSVKFAEATGMADVEERICSADSFLRQIEIFQDVFSDTVLFSPNTKNSSIIPAVLNEIYLSRGNIQIQDLEKKLNYSRRHLLRSFKASAGIDIKKFCRFIRFQTLLRELNCGKYQTLAEAAAEGGYYDQNHFQKEFRKFALSTPGAYCRLLKEIGYNEKITLVK